MYPLSPALTVVVNSVAVARTGSATSSPQLISRNIAGDGRKAIGSYEKALRLDPDYTLGYATLSSAEVSPFSAATKVMSAS